MKKIVCSLLLLTLLISSSYSQVATVPVFHTSGHSKAGVSVITYNPLLLNGHAYQLTFNRVTDTTVTWNLFDSTLAKTILSNQATIDNGGSEVKVDNMFITINDQNKRTGMIDYSIPNGIRDWSFSYGNGLELEGFNGAIGSAINSGLFSNTSAGDNQLKNVLIKFAQTDENGNISNSSDVNVSYAYRYLRHASYAAAKPEFAPYIINAAEGYAFQDYKKNLPFAAYDVSGSVPRRLMVGYLENNTAGGTVDGKYWPPAAGDYIDNTSTSNPREWFFIFNTDYSETPDPQLQVDILSARTTMLWFGTPTRRLDYFNAGDEFLIIAGKLNLTTNDTYSITTHSNYYPVPDKNKTKLNKSKIGTWIYNNGVTDINPSNADCGLFYPKGTQNNTMFASGLVWGGLVNGQIRAGGSNYSSGLQPGKLLSSGLAEDPTLPKNRIYRVRPGYNNADLLEESGDEWQTTDVIKQMYNTDWNEWPAADGAPFIDLDHNGIYNENTDIAGVKDAAQTVWYVCNDNNPNLTNYLFQSDPMGIEMQATFWNYDSSNFYDNIILRKYKLINKGSYPITDMYCSIWSDPDIGNLSDDLAGSDIKRNMCYAYNNNDIDAICGNLPSAVGFVFLQTPIKPSSGDSAYFDGKWRKNYVNVPMDASYSFGTVLNYSDPRTSVELYNYMQGKFGDTGEYFKDNNGNPTTYVFSGNPITQTGWTDQTPGDIRIGIAAGPFTMAVGDTQEVVIAQIAANASPLTGRNESLVNLFKYSDQVREAFPHAVGKIVSVKDDNHQKIKTFSLYQNYPNPFNPVTKISYEIPNTGMVTLKVYNLLGQEVAALINEIKNTGKYEVNFDAGYLSSGIYFYSINVQPIDGSMNYRDVKKMILLR